MSEEFSIPISREEVTRIFSNIPEFSEFEIVDIDNLIKGMLWYSTAPYPNDPSSNPLSVFTENLIKAAVELGSKGVKRK